MTAVLTRLLIPRVFHRIWLGGPLPDRARAFGETWSRHHPGWQLRLWTDADLPALTNQALFDAAEPAQKVDILRYELLLKHGGVFVDPQFEAFRSIEPLLDGVEAFCAREDGFRAGPGVLGSTAGHPFVAALVAALPDSIAWRPGRRADEQTGADLLSRVIAEQDALGNPIPAVFGPELFFPSKAAESHRSGADLPEPYAVHHGDGAWPAAAPAGDGVLADAAPEPEPAARILVTVDPDLVESAAVVLSGALEAARSVPGTELALIVKGVSAVTEQVGDAMAGLLQQLAGRRALPDIVVYGEPEGESLRAAVHVSLSADPEENVRSLRRIAALDPAAAGVAHLADRATDAGAVAPPPAAPDPAAVYVGNGRLLTRTAWGERLYCLGTDLTTTPALVLDGAAERPLCEYARRRLRPGDTAADVGAGIGAVTVRLAALVGDRGRVAAYEADPARLAVLRDNVTVNRLGEVIAIRDQAGPGSDVLTPPPRLVRLDAGPGAAEALAAMHPWLEHATDMALAIRVPSGDDRVALAEHIDRLRAEGWKLSALANDGAAIPLEPPLAAEVVILER